MCTLLLVDDSQTRSRYLKHLLTEIGHEVQALKSVELVPEKLKPWVFDLALVALLLRKSNGFEIGLRLQGLGIERVALVTMNPRATDVQWANALGLVGVLDAPTSFEKTKQQLQILL